MWDSHNTWSSVTAFDFAESFQDLSVLYSFLGMNNMVHCVDLAGLLF